MGPLVYTSGNAVLIGGQHLEIRASMGPLVYTSGNWRTSSATASAAARFNGAAGLHQRKRIERHGGGGGGASFNGAAGLHQRKPSVLAFVAAL